MLPCGAGKTVVGIAAIAAGGAHTLIIATNITSARQWIRELLDKTDLTEGQIGEYSGERKEVRPITVATYQVLTWSPHSKATRARTSLAEADGPGLPEDGPNPGLTLEEWYPHLGLFDRQEWGLII